MLVTPVGAIAIRSAYIGIQYYDIYYKSNEKTDKIKTIVRDSKDLFLRHIICQVGKITDSTVMVSQGSG